MAQRNSASKVTTETNQKAPNQNPFPYADYINARNRLMTALNGPCFYALLTGTSGMGKTELLRDITDSLDQHRHNIVYLASANISIISIVRFLATKLHVGVRRTHLETMDGIAEAIYAQTAHLVIWLDEADKLPLETMQEIRTLAEHKLMARQIVTVVLSGLPELCSKLENPALFPLKRRITHRCTLTGLNRDELDPFLEHRFGSHDAQRIPTNGRDDLFERTQATPAMIDQIARCALAQSKGTIDSEVIRDGLDAYGL